MECRRGGWPVRIDRTVRRKARDRAESKSWMARMRSSPLIRPSLQADGQWLWPSGGASPTSRVLNGKGSVSEVTRVRILRAARDLGYVPNLLARSLVMQATRAIGLVASDLSDGNLSRFIVGAEQEARRRGYSIIVTGVDGGGSGGGEALPALIERRVDGLL